MTGPLFSPPFLFKIPYKSFYFQQNYFDYLNQIKESDSGDKSDGDLVVDVGNEDESGRPQMNGDHRGENGAPPGPDRRDRPPSNMSSSSRSTPSLRHKV